MTAFRGDVESGLDEKLNNSENPTLVLDLHIFLFFLFFFVLSCRLTRT